MIAATPPLSPSMLSSMLNELMTPTIQIIGKDIRQPGHADVRGQSEPKSVNHERRNRELDPQTNPFVHAATIVRDAQRRPAPCLRHRAAPKADPTRDQIPSRYGSTCGGKSGLNVSRAAGHHHRNRPDRKRDDDSQPNSNASAQWCDVRCGCCDRPGRSSRPSR